MRADEWREWILHRLPQTPVRVAAPAAALGGVLAEDARAAQDLPLWDSSAMDGYAVRVADLAGAGDSSPAELRVIGEIPAGSGDDPALEPGTTVRIMTGAAVPSDADAVIPVEHTAAVTEDGSWLEAAWAETAVRVLRRPEPGANIRRSGEDARTGDVLGRAGERLTAARAAALASAGVAEVRVRRTPRVAVLVTGSELAGPGEPLTRGRISESNSALLAGLLRERGIEPELVERRSDDAEGLRARLAELAASHDAIVTSGGIGPGTHDVVRMAVQEEPGVRAVGVDMKPGRPQCAGLLRGGAFLFALPGNPVSAAVSFEMFVGPALLAMQGSARIERLRVPAIAGTGWRGAMGRLQVMPVRVEERDGVLSCAPAVDPRAVSHAVARHGAVDGYALVDEEHGDVFAGDPVRVILVAS